MRDLSFNIWADWPTSRLLGERSSERAPRLGELAPHRPGAVDPTYVVEELVDVEGLDQVVRCPLFEGGHGLAHVGEGRHQDEVRERRVPAHGAQQGQPVDTGQAHVADDDIEHRLPQQGGRLRSVARLDDDVSGIRQDIS